MENLKEPLEKYKDVDFVESYKQTFLPKETVDSLQYETTTLIVGDVKYP